MKKYISLIATLAAVGGLALAVPAFAQQAPNGQYGFGNGRMNGGQAPAVVGTVSAISGTTLTVNSKAWPNGGMATTYTVDATNATVTKNNAASTVSAIAVGDTVMIQGTVSGTSVTATTIRDGIMPGGARGSRQNGGAAAQPVIQGNGQPVVAGSITAISGNSITITNKSNVTYMIDATNAKFVVSGVTSPTISNLAVGDNLVIQGTVNGTSVTASSIIDQKAPPTNTSTNISGSGQPSSPGIFGGIGHIFGGIGNFFKHMFGF